MPVTMKVPTTRVPMSKTPSAGEPADVEQRAETVVSSGKLVEEVPGIDDQRDDDEEGHCERGERPPTEQPPGGGVLAPSLRVGPE